MDPSYAKRQAAHHQSQLAALLSNMHPNTSQSQVFQVPRVGTSLDGRPLSSSLDHPKSRSDGSSQSSNHNPSLSVQVQQTLPPALSLDPLTSHSATSGSISDSWTGSTVDTPITSPTHDQSPHKTPLDLFDPLHMGNHGSIAPPFESVTYGASVDAHKMLDQAYNMLSQWTPGLGFGPISARDPSSAENTFAFVTGSLNMGQASKPMDSLDSRLYHPSPVYASYPSSRVQDISGKGIGVDPGVLGGYKSSAQASTIAVDDEMVDPPSPPLRALTPHDFISNSSSVRRSSRTRVRPRSDSNIHRQSTYKSVIEESDEDEDELDEDDDEEDMDDGHSPQRLDPIDMADEEELEQLRMLEMGGPALKKDKRRLQNKLAQRSFRARSRIVKKHAASHLAEVEVKTINQFEELKLLRIMVENLRKENTELKRRFSEDFPTRSLGSVHKGGRKRKASNPNP